MFARLQSNRAEPQDPEFEPSPTLQSWRRGGGGWARLPDLDWGKASVAMDGEYYLETLLALPSGSALAAGWGTPLHSEFARPIGPYRLE